MAGSARYTAILDACVLYPAPLRDLLLSLAAEGLYHARWTPKIQSEWIDNLLKNRSDLSRERLERTSTLMAKSVQDSQVENYESIIESLTLPDPNDRHVLAAAIVGHADSIVTFNLKDFPNEVLKQFDIEAQHPDDFIANQFELHQLSAVSAVKKMRERLRNPPKTQEDLIETFKALALPTTASLLSEKQIRSLI